MYLDDCVPQIGEIKKGLASLARTIRDHKEVLDLSRKYEAIGDLMVTLSSDEDREKVTDAIEFLREIIPSYSGLIDVYKGKIKVIGRTLDTLRYVAQGLSDRGTSPDEIRSYFEERDRVYKEEAKLKTSEKIEDPKQIIKRQKEHQTDALFQTLVTKKLMRIGVAEDEAIDLALKPYPVVVCYALEKIRKTYGLPFPSE